MSKSPSFLANRIDSYRMDIQVDIDPKKFESNLAIISAANLTRAVFVFFLEIDDTGGFTTIVIIAIQYTLAERLTVLGYTGF